MIMRHEYVSFSYIKVSQGSVAMQLRCGGIFNNYIIANFDNWLPIILNEIIILGD